MVKNETTRGAFFVLVASATFISKLNGQYIQRRVAHIHTQRRDYEREKLEDEHHRYKAEKQKNHHSVATNQLMVSSQQSRSALANQSTLKPK